jgi:hypothetical protein
MKKTEKSTAVKHLDGLMQLGIVMGESGDA